MVSWLIHGVRRAFWIEYVRLLYTVRRAVDPRIRRKADRILRCDEAALHAQSGAPEERALPGHACFRKTGYHRYMLGRYLYAVPFIRGKRVLDCAAGLGWGSFLVCDYPESLLSIDIDEDAIRFAEATWQDPKLSFARCSALELPSLGRQFDVILAYEFIEHLSLEQGEKFVRDAAGVLSRGGRMILSSRFPHDPAKARRAEQANPHHLHVFSEAEIRRILAESGFGRLRFVGDVIVVAQKAAPA